MKIIITISLIGLLSLKSFSQIKEGFYKGLERMCWTKDNGKIDCYDSPKKWYHENLLFIQKDSFFLYKMPVQMIGKRKIYSASDGAFYYYLGTSAKTETGTVVNFAMNNCDYCPMERRIDTVTGFMYPVIKTVNYKLIVVPNGLKIGNVLYYKKAIKHTDIWYKQMCYFDSNNIYREDPKEQYKLISTGIKNFLQTKELKLDNDTLRICSDRYSEDSLIEALKSSSLIIDTTGMVFKYYTQSELNALVKNSNKAIRYIKVGRIIDYWKTARISLTYIISLPKSIHNFSERQFLNLFEYNKIGNEYRLIENLPENSWELIEQK